METTMRGMVLGFDSVTGAGMAAGDNGQRFPFSRPDWKSAFEPLSGMKIDFATTEGKAVEVYPVPEAGINGNGVAVKTPQAQQAFKLGCISLGCAIGGVIVPMIGLILSIASLVTGIKGFNLGRASGEQAGQIMGVIGAIVGGLTILFYLASLMFIASVGAGFGMLVRGGF